MSTFSLRKKQNVATLRKYISKKCAEHHHVQIYTRHQPGSLYWFIHSKILNLRTKIY